MGQKLDRGKTPEKTVHRVSTVDYQPDRRSTDYRLQSEPPRDINKWHSFKSRLIAWRPTLGLLAADFLMRIAINIVSIQVAKFETYNYYGYTSLLPFYLSKYYGAIPAGVIGVLVSSVFADSEWTIGNVCIVSGCFVLITISLGFMTYGFEGYYGLEAVITVSVVMNVFIFSIIVFEAACFAMAFERTELLTAETLLPVIWTICISMIWLRELAAMITILIVFFTSRDKYFVVIINSLALGCVITYALLVFLLRHHKEGHRSRKIPFIQAIVVLLLHKALKPEPVTVGGVTHENKFTTRLFGDAFSLSKITKFLMSFAVYYYAQQYLIVVWFNKFKSINIFSSVKRLEARFLVLTLPNLINVPLVNILFVWLHPKLKKIRIDDLKLLGFAYLILFISLVVTVFAQSTATEVYQETNATVLFVPDGEKLNEAQSNVTIAKMRIINESNFTCKFTTKWETDVMLNHGNMYQSAGVTLNGLKGVPLVLSCTVNSVEQRLSKSIFLDENKIATFILTTKTFDFTKGVKIEVRRVDKYETTGIMPFCDWDIKASLTVYSTIEKSGKIIFFNDNGTFDLVHSSKTHERIHKYVTVGTYEAYGFVASKQSPSKTKTWTFQPGGVHVVVVRKTQGKTILYKRDFQPWERRFEQSLSDCPKRWPATLYHSWTIVSLYLLSLSQSIESVVMLHFLIAESPYELRCVLISMLVLSRLFGSAAYYATEIVWQQNHPVVGLFVTAVFLLMNACLYWYTSSRYIRPEYPPET